MDFVVRYPFLMRAYVGINNTEQQTWHIRLTFLLLLKQIEKGMNHPMDGTASSHYETAQYRIQI